MIEINIDKPHDGQEYIANNAQRYNVIKCGRRWGKTTFCHELILSKALQTNPYDKDSKGYPVAYYAPTYKDLSEFWDTFTSTVADIIEKKDESEKKVVLINGGKIDFWSLEHPDSSRGRAYGRVIIDECEKIKKIEYAWTKTVRATLTDYVGDAWFFSTPNRLGNPNSYFLDTLCKNQKSKSNWMTYTAPSAQNPHLPEGEIEEARDTLDDLSFQQEYLALDVRKVDRPFIYAFTDANIDETIDYNPYEPFELCFDFNVDPATCLIRQHGPDYCYTLDEIRVENTDPYEICEEVKTRFGEKLFLVYGDASGHNRNFAVKGNKSIYQIISAELNLKPKQIRVPRSNPFIKESRTLTNSLFARFPNYLVHPRCEYYIQDLRYVGVDEKGLIDKKADAHKSHLLDCGRYHDWECLKWWLKKSKRQAA